MGDVIIILLIIGGGVLIWKWFDVLKSTRGASGYAPRMIVYYLLSGLIILFGLNSIIADFLFKQLTPFGYSSPPENYTLYSLIGYLALCASAIFISIAWNKKNKKVLSQKTGDVYGPNIGPMDSGGGPISININPESKKKEKIAPKFITNIPKIQGDDFIGRDNELEEIRQKSEEPGKSILLTGIGGIGKTSLAMAFAGAFSDNFEYLIWLDQSGSFESSITDNPTLLNNLEIESLTGNPMQKTEFVFNRISNLEDPGLLIIDNADEQVQPYVRLLPKNCCTIICSRYDLDCDEKISVDFLNWEEAVKLFYNHYDRDQNDEVVAEIIELLDYHTLAIELVSKTAQVLRITPLEELLIQLKEKGLKDTRSSDIKIPHSKDTKVDNIFSYFCAIFDFGGHSEKELLLLKYFAVLPSRFIPFPELEEIFALGNKSIEERDEITGCINSLKAKGWLIYNDHIDAFKMHRIIQEAVIEKLKPVLPELSELVENITALVHYDNSKADHNLIDKLKWYPYGERLGLHFLEENDEPFAFLLNRLGSLACMSGKYEIAEKFLVRALEIAKELLGKDNVEIAKYSSELAILYASIGRFEKAIEFTEYALNIEEKNYEENHKFLAIRCANLTSYYRRVENFDEARAYGERAIEISLHNFPSDDSRVAVCQSELGLVYKDAGHNEKARQLLKEAYEKDLKNYGENDPRVANRKSNLGMVYRDLEEFDKAYNLVKEALDSDLENFGEENPTVVIRRSNLGMILKDMGQLQEAQKNLEIALSVGEEIFSINHPKFAQIQANLASVLYELHDFPRGQNLINSAIETLNATLGSEHRLTKQALIFKKKFQQV